MARRKTTLTVKPVVLKDRIACGTVDSVLIQGFDGGFRILIGLDGVEKPLGLVKEDRERVFKKLATAEAHLVKFGIAHFNVDAARRSPEAKPAKGPGQAAAAERTREAIAYDAWFREGVEEALAQVEAGTAELIPLMPDHGRLVYERAVARIQTRRQAALETESRTALESGIRGGVGQAHRGRQPTARKGRRTKAL